jgi:predicted Zn-dependent peptidase
MSRAQSPAAIATAVPPLTSPSRPRKPSSAERTLANGVRVVVVRKRGVPLVEVRLRVPFLSAKATHAARATVLSDTVLSGTDRYDRAGLAAAVQALGGDLSASVDADRLLLSANAIATNLAPLLAILADVLTTARYPSDEVQRERARLVERLTIARSRAGVVAAEALAHRMYGEHPYARELPQVTDVSTVTRTQVARLHAELVRPAGAVLVIVGDVSLARTLDIVARSLSSWDGSRKAERVPALPSFENGPVVLVDRPGSVQSSLRLGGVALRRDADAYPALQLANLIFGGYFSSRWNENIREDKGYTYGPHSRIEHNVLGSSLVLDADVATEVTAPALLETAYELGKISALPVTDHEVGSVRQYAIGTLALSTATQAGLATTLTSLLGTGLDLDWMIEHPRRLAKVTTEDVSAAAAEFFAPSRLVTVIVGDAASVAAPLQALTRVVPDGLPS